MHNEANTNLKCILNIQEREMVYKKYRTLWRAVILQALVDLKSNSNKKSNNINRTQAMIWINPNKKEFKTVCERAELDPNFIYECKLKIMNKKNFAF